MKKHILLVLILITPHVSLASEWVAIDGGITEVKLNSEKVESELWKYINKESKIKFKAKEKYTYQYQAINSEIMSINTLCETYGKTLNTNFILVLDGGSCYFQINYNYKTGVFSELQVNGEA